VLLESHWKNPPLPIPTRLFPFLFSFLLLKGTTLIHAKPKLSTILFSFGSVLNTILVTKVCFVKGRQNIHVMSVMLIVVLIIADRIFQSPTIFIRCYKQFFSLACCQNQNTFHHPEPIQVGSSHFLRLLWLSLPSLRYLHRREG
jgi:hypothetical protein